MSWLKSGLSIRQTAYAVSVVVVLAMAISSIEVIRAYRSERQHLISIMNQWFESVADTSARAAYHVDQRQGAAVLDGLIKFKILAYAKLTTDLGVVLAERRRTIAASVTDPVAAWLFDDIVRQQRALAFDRSTLAPSPQPSDGGTSSPHMRVGSIELHASPVLVGRDFLVHVGGLIAGLALEFFLLAAALAFIFHRTLTRPLLRYADQLSRIDPQGATTSKATVPPGHERDELGLVVIRTNELLQRIQDLREAEMLAKEALTHQERVSALGSLLAGVAHELNNPLAILTAQAELLSETARDEKTRDRADKILKPAERCARIVRTFLALARQREVKKEHVDIKSLITDVCDLLAYPFKTHDISVSVEIEPGLPAIWGNGAQLSQAFINLLVNAQQAVLDVPSPRMVRIQALRGGNNLLITVSDNGPGIPVAIRHRIFEPFFTTKAEGQGTGMGLSYCLSVVTNHSGAITVGQQRERGAAITITLPMQAPLAKAVDDSNPTETRTGPALRVLIVDDEVGMAHTLVEQLEHLGHAAIGCSTGMAALDMLNTHSFDLILSDIRMPGVDGLSLYEEVRRRHASLADRFIFITGDSLDEHARHFIEIQQAPCLHKPYQIKELENAINHVMAAGDRL